MERTVILDLRETINAFNNRLLDASITVTPWAIRKMTEHMIHVAFGQNPNVIARNVAESMLHDTDNLLAYALLVGHADNIADDLTYYDIGLDHANDDYRYRLAEDGSLAVWISPKPVAPLADQLFESAREDVLRSIENGDFVSESIRRMYNI